MKVLYLSDDFPPRSMGGAGFSTFELAEAVQRAGHEVAVVTTCREPHEAGKSLYAGLTVYAIASAYDGRWRGWRGVYNPRATRELKALLQEIRPDIVHANNVHHYLSFASVALAGKYARVVWTARDLMAVCYGKLDTARYLARGDTRISWLDNLRQARLRYNPFKNLLVRRYLKDANRYAVSEALAGALVANGITGVEAIHTGVDPAAWEASPEALAAFRERFALLGKRVILFAGRLSREKGGAVAIEALTRAVKQVPDALLLVAGPLDGYARTMQQKARELGVAEHLAFTGWLAHEEMRIAYAAAEVTWAPSLYLDPFPRTVLEAMAASRPVIATKYGGAKETVEDGVTGYVIDPRNTQEMAEKTLAILTDPARAAALGRAAKERIERGFNLAAYAARYLAAYGDASQQNRK